MPACPDSHRCHPQLYPRWIRASQVRGSERLGITEPKNRSSPVKPYNMKNGNARRFRLRNPELPAAVVRKWPALVGERLIASIARNTSARNRKARASEICEYCARSAGYPERIPDESGPSFQSGQKLFFGKTFNTPCCKIFDSPNAFFNSGIQRRGSNDTFNKTPSQIEALFRRQFKRYLSQVC
jgi:hypothetical protein